MDLLTITILAIIIYASIRAVHSLISPSPSPSNLPPGPKSLPIIGNLHQLGDKPHKSLANLAKRHGPIMTLQLGRVTTVVVSSPTAAKLVLQTHDHNFSNRTIPDAIRAHGHHRFGLPWIPISPPWRSLRRICNSELFSSKALDSNQALRRTKVAELRDRVARSEAVDVGGEAFTASLNLLSNTVFSVDLADPESELAAEFREASWRVMKEAGTPNVGDYFPVLKRVDPQGIRRRLGVQFGRLLGLFEEIVEERVRVNNSKKKTNGDGCEDVLDTLLGIVQQTQLIDTTHMLHLLLVLFVAGTGTTAATLQWAMAELLKNPNVLTKARAELNQAIGKGNPVEELDIPRLPYLQAILKETFRLHPAVPLLLPRKSDSDVEVEGGFVVPKGSQVLVNVWAIGRDVSVWGEDAEEFRPERFLGSEIDVRGKSFEIIPFGGGRRICPGLPLAMRMLHCMLGTLIHSFEWRLEHGVEPCDVDLEDKFGITLEMAKPLRAIPTLIV